MLQFFTHSLTGGQISMRNQHGQVEPQLHEKEKNAAAPPPPIQAPGTDRGRLVEVPRPPGPGGRAELEVPANFE